MTDGLPPPRRPTRSYAPPSAVPYTPPGLASAPSSPGPAQVPPAPRAAPRRSLLSVVLVGAVLVVLSLLLGSLGDVDWPWTDSAINGMPAASGE